jgi:adenosylmethionine-8-amino-7-oxononanoate aminotransferase
MGPTGPSTDRATLQRQVKNNLLLNFTDMSEFADSDVRVFVRGDGCHVVDAEGRRAIDGISGLFCTNLGHGFGAEIGAAAQRQVARLAFTLRGTSRTRRLPRWPSGWRTWQARWV